MIKYLALHIAQEREEPLYNYLFKQYHFYMTELGDLGASNLIETFR